VKDLRFSQLTITHYIIFLYIFAGEWISVHRVTSVPADFRIEILIIFKFQIRMYEYAILHVFLIYYA
jgi:hypothetical protein